ncbi:hypothetical protein PHLCEN_2v3136 [Hermanssonia centrifuga]|uniref:Uncharacterized protein n=1 Tax=Hermanssonia centrifuga TaxID=98765 RepID=A0A2R6R102_9APHY|nr:hypothetical protein PHLCEN_2v3136 [Hermanssonia centrifuga]
MPTRAHTLRPGQLARTHSRTSSGGGSKVGLNLQLTQKEPAPPRFPDKPKKNQLLHEPNNKSSVHLSRNNSSVRLQSKEHVNPSVFRRAPTPLGNNKGSSSKGRVGFTISSPSEGDDDDWVSSESGAATPVDSQDSDVEEVAVTPVEKHKPRLPTITNGFVKDDHPTPRADPLALPRVETMRPSQETGPLPAISAVSAYAPAQRQSSQTIHPPPQRLNTPPVQQLHHQQSLRPESQPTPPHVTKAHSETHSPPRRSPDAPKRQAMTRPPSTHSITNSSVHAMRPHPLIRANSAGHGALLQPAKPAPLAPLTTRLVDSVPAQMSSASSPTSLRAVSPTFNMQGSSVSPVLSQPSPTGSEASKQLRRTSTSSRSSVATIPSGAPLLGSASHAQLSRTTNHDRQRTLSSSSTFAALSNLNLVRGAPSPPKTPVQHLTVRFPPMEQIAQSESVHTLLPPPYLSAHLTMLAHRNPLGESYDRVMRAKQAR